MTSLSDDEKKSLWEMLQKLRDKSLKLAGIGHELPFPPRWAEAEED
jgi:hypothetical protein